MNFYINLWRYICWNYQEKSWKNFKRNSWRQSVKRFIKEILIDFLKQSMEWSLKEFMENCIKSISGTISERRTSIATHTQISNIPYKKYARGSGYKMYNFSMTYSMNFPNGVNLDGDLNKFFGKFMSELNAFLKEIATELFERLFEEIPGEII